MRATTSVLCLLAVCTAHCAHTDPLEHGTAAAPAPQATGTDTEPGAVQPATEPAPVPEPTPAIAQEQRLQAIVASQDRSEADRALDAGRHPAQTLAFFGVQQGHRVGEIASGTGYTAELLARAVGPDGRVYAVNNAFVLQKFAEAPWAQRLAKPVMQNVVRVDREFDAPFGPDVHDLDLVCNVLFYHDTVWMKTDRAAMNAAIFAALKPGGAYVVIDHAAAQGHGAGDAQTLHRIEASLVRAEIEAAGFQLVQSSDFLANPSDTRDWSASPGTAGDRRGTSDRFAMKFIKPSP